MADTPVKTDKTPSYANSNVGTQVGQTYAPSPAPSTNTVGTKPQFTVASISDEQPDSLSSPDPTLNAASATAPASSGLSAPPVTTPQNNTTESAASVPSASADQIEPTKTQIEPVQKTKHTGRVLTLLGLAVVVFVLLLIGAFRFVGNRVATNVTTSDPSDFIESEVPLKDVLDSALGALEITSGNTLVVNGAFVLSPSGEPSSPVLGQIYYNVGNNTLYYYNGTSFISVTEDDIDQAIKDLNVASLCFNSNNCSYVALQQGSTSFQSGSIAVNGSGEFGGNLQVAGTITGGVLGSADTSSYLCRNSSNQIATCTSGGAGSAFVQGGNSYGSAATLGTNDNFALNFETNGVRRGSFENDGALNLVNGEIHGETGIVGFTVAGIANPVLTLLNFGTPAAYFETSTTTIQSSVNSTDAFKVSNSAGTNIFRVDTANGRAALGTAVAFTPALLQVQGTISGSSCTFGCWGITSTPGFSGTLNAVGGVRLGYTVASGTTAAQGHGLYIDAPTVTGGSTLTSAYGITIAAQTAATNNYGIIIGAASTNTVWVSHNADNTTASAGVVFGSSKDTNLYRGAANQLNTDDNLKVGLHAAVGPGASINQTGYDFITLDGSVTTTDTSQNVLSLQETYTSSLGAGNNLQGGVNNIVTGNYATDTSSILVGVNNLTGISASNVGNVGGLFGINNNVVLAGSGDIAVGYAQGINNVVDTSAYTGSAPSIVGVSTLVKTPLSVGAGSVFGEILSVSHEGGIGSDLQLAYGLATSIVNSGAGGTIEYAYGINVGEASGLITNNYGIYITDQSGAGISSSYNIYSEGAGENYFGGNIIANSLGANDTSTYLCRNSSNQIATCNSSGTGTAFIQGGNSFGATAILGTNDSNALHFETDNTVRGKISGTTGHWAIGNSANPDDVTIINGSTTIRSTLILEESVTDVTSSNLVQGFTNYLQVTPSAAPTAQIIGSDSRMSIAATQAFGNPIISAFSRNEISVGTEDVSSQYGEWNQVTTNALYSGDITGGQIGSYIDLQHAGSGNLSSQVGQLISRSIQNGTTAGSVGVNVGDVSGGATITENVGIYVGDQTAGVSDYGIVIEGADTYALWLGSGADNTDAANGVAFGLSQDTNLYRGASSLLKTDSSLHVVDRLQVGSLIGSIDQCNSGLGLVDCFATAEFAGASTETTNFTRGINNVVAITPNGATNTVSNDGSYNLLTLQGAQSFSGTNSAVTGYTNNSTTAGTVTSLVGVSSSVEQGGSGSTVTEATGLTTQVIQSAGTLSTAYGINVKSAAGTIGANYGIRVGSQTAGTTDYGIAIGAADTNTLWVNNTSNSTTAAGGIVFGSSRDTNLYRSAANTLQTDDRLVVGDTAAGGIRFGSTSGANIYQSGDNLQINTANSGVTYIRGNAAGNIYLGLDTDSGNIQLRRQTIISSDIDTVKLAVQAAAGQTANLQDWRNSSGTQIAAVDASGRFVATTLGSADTSTYLCRNSSNQISTCSSSGSGAAFIQGGNSFGATATLGTNDGNSLAFETNSTTFFLLNTSGLLQGSNGATFSVPGGGTQSERFGGIATANGDSSLAVGYGADSDGANSVAIGHAAGTPTDNSVAVGSNAVTSGTGESIAIGRLAFSDTDTRGISIGSNSLLFGDDIILLGADTVGTGGNSIVIGHSAISNSASSIVLGNSATSTAANQFVAGSSTNAITNAYFGNGVTNGSPSAFTFNATGGAGTNIQGANLALAGGRGTGSAAGGSLLFQTSVAGGSGTSLNNLSTVLTLQGGTGAAIFQNTSDSLSAFRVNNSSGASIFSVATGGFVPGGLFGDDTAGIVGNAGFNDATSSSGFVGVLQGATEYTDNRVITIPDENGTLCLINSASCGFATGSGSAFVQGGNAFGATATLGTNDSNSLAFETNDTSYFTLDTSGLLRGSNGATLSVPGVGSNSEKFGALATSDGASSLAVGYGADSDGASSIAIGHDSGTLSDNSIAIGASALANGDSSIAIGSGAATTASNQLVIGSGSSAISNAFIGNGVTNASPNAVTLQSTGGSGTDIAGANFTLAGGRGTGAGVGGSILLQIAQAGGSGTSLNSLSTVASFSGTDGSAIFQNAVDSTSGFKVQDADGGTSIFNVDTINERVGIGDDTPDYTFDLDGTVSSEDYGRAFNVEATTTDDAYTQQSAAAVTLIANPTSASTRQYVGTSSVALTSGANLAGGTLTGVLGAAYNSGTGTVGTGIGLQSSVSNGSTGVITDAVSIQADAAIAGAGSITNAYGIRVAAQTAGTNNYGVVIGDAGTNTLWVNNTNDSTDEAGGIVFGSSRDTNLYRGGANILKTSDNFHVVDKLQVGSDAFVGSFSQCNFLLGFADCTAGVEAGVASVESTNASFGLRGALTITPTSTNTATSAGLSGIVATFGDQNFTGSVRALEGSALAATLGTTTNLTGIFGTAQAVLGTTTNAYGIQALVQAGASITANTTGIEVQSTTGTATGANYGILVRAQTAGATDYGIAIGAADTQTLWVNNTSNSTTAAGGIAFGSSRDTNLYRSAANTLRTDDSFNVNNQHILSTSGAVVFNETSIDQDFRIESNDDINNFFSDGGTNRIGIGTGTPGYKLDVLADVSASYVANFFNDGNNADRYGIQIQAGADDGSGTTYYLNALDGNGDQVGYIANDSGTFGLTDVSDARTKTNIGDTSVDGLSVINALSVKDYNRLSNPSGDIITGFIAQEVLDVYGQAVTLGPDGFYGIRKDAFIPVLVKGVQELDQKVSVAQGTVDDQGLQIVDVQTQVDELNGEVAGLQTQLDELSAAQLAFQAQLDQQSQQAQTPVFVESKLTLGLQEVAVADSGNAGAPTVFSISPTASYIEINCADADGCQANLEVSGASQGFSAFMFNVGANPVTVLDTPGVAELAGNFIMGAYDSLSTVKLADRWVEISRSDN